MFRKHELNVPTEANTKGVTFLDIELDLEAEQPPPSVTSNIPAAVNKRLSALSSSKEMFDSLAPVYQNALEDYGYDYKLDFTPVSENPPKTSRNCKRQTIWFNPPFSTSVKTSVKTNIGKDFL